MASMRFKSLREETSIFRWNNLKSYKIFFRSSDNSLVLFVINIILIVSRKVTFISTNSSSIWFKTDFNDNWIFLNYICKTFRKIPVYFLSVSFTERLSIWSNNLAVFINRFTDSKLFFDLFSSCIFGNLSLLFFFLCCFVFVSFSC